LFFAAEQNALPLPLSARSHGNVTSVWHSSVLMMIFEANRYTTGGDCLLR
jgi:hypothetical protein